MGSSRTPTRSADTDVSVLGVGKLGGCNRFLHYGRNDGGGLFELVRLGIFGVEN